MGRITAKVAVARAVYAIDKPYDYLVPAELEGVLAPGMRVLVPFAAGNRTSEGIVLSPGGGALRRPEPEAHPGRPGLPAGAGPQGAPAGPVDAGSGTSARCTTV